MQSMNSETRLKNKPSWGAEICRNAYVPLLPVLVWHLVFAGRLPQAYQPESFNSGVPWLVLAGENIFRLVIFALPLFARLDLLQSRAKKGLWLYVVGLSLYFLSWLALIYAPASNWSSGLLGFVAPAYTPVIWLVGLSWMIDGYYWATIKYAVWHYLVPVLLFAGFHVVHAWLVFERGF